MCVECRVCDPKQPLSIQFDIDQHGYKTVVNYGGARVKHFKRIGISLTTTVCNVCVSIEDNQITRAYIYIMHINKLD